MRPGDPLSAGLRRVCVLAVLSAGLLFAVPAHAADVYVEETTAAVGGTQPIPSIVRERMERTIAAIAAERMEGRRTAEIDPAEEERIIGAVFDRLLVGYTVTDVRVRPGTRAAVEIRLVPWADTIADVTLNTEVEGMPPAVEALVRKDLAGVEQVFSDALVGLPLAATDWAAGALKRRLTAYMDAHLPEFRADYDVDVDRTATVRLTVYPRLPVVRTVDLSMRSDTIPNVTLLTRRSVMETEVNRLVGVPVGFIERHRGAFEEQMAGALDSGSDFRRLRLTSHVEITPGERMRVMSRTDTTRYRLRLTGWLDIGRTSEERRGARRSNLRVRLHAGRMLGRRDELYFETDAAPEDVRFDWRLGYARTLAPRLTGELRYDLREGQVSVAGTYELHPRWLLRYEHFTADGTGEVELRYKVHDFLSLAGLIDRHDAWLRVIGNF
ncbi:hypothetical protein [Selenomonas sp. F0473]|uniref:hypothetical protein n=1 Tax=Selenomonas sp. F0473 TaxID=999423 RepID=UPI00029E5E68|nr:hypothetical protein [Selenomonas sp. F0473]EKU72165.1 hypothetical protein HMPREF9161_00850 [Selenomonas sp. F0473]